MERRRVYGRTYNENGTLNRVEEFHSDVSNGILLTFETNGSLQREQYSQNGALEGILHEYSGGILKLEEVYENGKLNGWRRVFTQ